MPQPLSTFTPESKSGSQLINFTPNAIFQRPILAVKVMLVISLWSHIEHSFARMMGAFLKTDFEIITEMLLALTSGEGRRAAIDGAAKAALTDDDYFLYQAVLKTTKPSRDRRNEYAHHMWGIVNFIPDSLLLVDPRYFTRLDAKNDQSIKDYIDAFRLGVSTGMLEQELLEFENPDLSQIMVYRDTDIERDVRDANKAADMISSLRFAISDHPGRALMRSKLLAEPLVQQALQPKSTENGK